jgi:hypothetical protein
MAGLFSRNLREMNDSAMLQRKTNPIAAGIPLKIAKNPPRRGVPASIRHPWQKSSQR